MSRNADEILDWLMDVGWVSLNRDGTIGISNLKMYWDKTNEGAHIFYNESVNRGDGYVCLRWWRDVDPLTAKCIIQAFLQGDTFDEP